MNLLLLCISLFLLLLLHASVNVKGDYFTISQSDINICKQQIGGTDAYNSLISYLSSLGVTINHGGYGGGDPNTQKSATINTWSIGEYSNGVFTCIPLDDTYPQYTEGSSCPTKTQDGTCVPPLGLSPVSYISCSCQGVCLRASTNFYDYQNYKPPNGNYAKPTWATCVCHPDYYGERCQYKKGSDDIARLVAGSIDIRDFPYLPWYTTPQEKSNWLFYKQATMTYNSHYTPYTESVTVQDSFVPYLSGQYIWSQVKTQVARGLDYSSTTWSWPGSAHSCPYGMTLVASYGTGLPSAIYNGWSWASLPFPDGNTYYFTDHPGSFSSANDAYLYYYGKTRQRQHFVCMCDPNRGSDGCSGQGACTSLINGQNITFDLQYHSQIDPFTMNQDYYITMSISDTSFFPPSIGSFPNAFWESLPNIILPNQWSVCECFPDFYGLYCEIDNRNQAVCDNKGVYFDTLSGPNVNKWDEPGDCTCTNGAIHFWVNGVPPTQPKDATNLHPNYLTGYNRDTFYRLSTDRVNPPRRQHVCMDDKDITRCNDRGVFNSVYALGGDPNSPGRSLNPQVGCECFLYNNTGQTQLYDRTRVNSNNLDYLNGNRALRENIAGGDNCLSTCRISHCNNHGTCKYELRSTYYQQYSKVTHAQFYYNWDVLSSLVQSITLDPHKDFMYWPTEDSTPKPYNISDIVISDVCECDDGWSGDNCQHNVASGANCNGFGLAGSSNTSSCYGLCDPSRSFYNDTLARCIGLCPNMTAFDPTDPYTVDTSGINQPCGGPVRGTCSWLGVGDSKTCVCNPGFTNPEKGCNLSICPRVRGQMCNGRGTCEPQPLVTSSGIGRPVYRCECQSGWKGEACEIQDRIDNYKCNSNTQQSYNRENLDWPIL